MPPCMCVCLQANLGTKVVSFGAPAGTVSAPGARDPDAGIGYLPLDPPGVFVVEAEEEEDGGEGQERARREQLAIQAEGALTPAFGESLPQFVQRRTRELNEATRERPKDEAAWLDLAAFQSVALDAGVKLKRRDLAVIDKQVAVYERGLEQCPHSIRLFRAMLRAAQEIRTREEVCVSVLLRCWCVYHRVACRFADGGTVEEVPTVTVWRIRAVAGLHRLRRLPVLLLHGQ